MNNYMVPMPLTTANGPSNP